MYATFVELSATIPMTHVFHRNPKQHLNLAVRGQGIQLFDQNGKGYIDASGGAAVSCLGHGHPDIIQAIKDQLDKVAYAHSSIFTTQVTEDLSDFLQQRSHGDLDHVYFVSVRAEARRVGKECGYRGRSCCTP